MATIKDTLVLEDRMSQTIKAVQTQLDRAAASTKIAKTEMEMMKKTYGSTSVEAAKATLAWSKQAQQVENLENKLAKLKTQQDQNVKGFESMSGKIVTLSAGFQLIGQAINGIKSIGAAMDKYIGLYQTQTVAEDKLAIITKQRMALTDDEVRSLYDLAAAQQKIGVIGDEVTLAGMAGLASFAKQKSTIETLTPAMNNLAVKMYGYNATAESMDMISKSLGKAMLGDVGALSRMGVKIDDNKKKWLMSLNEQQRTIELSKIIKNVTGDLNAEFAKTPLGRITQQQNKLGDSLERLGKILLPIKAMFVTFYTTVVTGIVNLIEKFTSLFKNAQFMEGLFENLIIIGGALVPVLAVLAWNALKAGASFVWTGLQAAWAGREALLAGLKAAGAWIAANAPLLIVIASVSALMVIFIKFNKVVEQVLNFCIDKFFNFVQVVLSGVRTIASAIDSVFKTNLTVGVDKMSKMAESARGAAKKGTQEMQKWLDGVGKTDYVAKLTAKTSGLGTNQTNAITKNPMEKFSDGGALKTKQQGAIELKEEDIKALNELATRDFMIRYQALSPNVNFGNVTVNENADINQLIGTITSGVQDIANNNLNTGVGK